MSEKKFFLCIWLKEKDWATIGKDGRLLVENKEENITHFLSLSLALSALLRAIAKARGLKPNKLVRIINSEA